MEMMGTDLLQQSLRQELKLIEELNQLSHLKTEVLLKDDLDSLEAIALKEEALSKKLKRFDDACSQQVQFFLKGQSDGSAIPAETRELVDKIKMTARELQMNNELNLDLIRDSLTLVQFTINSLLSLSENNPGLYQQSGKISNRKETHLLDYKG
jgi:hypothetical protein